MLALRPLGPYFCPPRHLWAFTPGVFTHGHCQAAGVLCLLERLSGKPNSWAAESRDPSPCLPFFKCAPQISLSPSSVAGMLPRLGITDGDPALDSRGSQSGRGGPRVTRQWAHGDGAYTVGRVNRVSQDALVQVTELNSKKPGQKDIYWFTSQGRCEAGLPSNLVMSPKPGSSRLSALLSSASL